MVSGSSTLMVALWAFTQTPAPAADSPAPSAVAPAAASAAPLAPADPAAAPTATDAAAAPAPDAASAVPVNPRHWRKEKVPVAGGGQEIRVLRADDTAVSLGEGLSDVQQTERLTQRARRLDDSQTNWETIAGRVAVLCAGGVLLAGGVVGGLLGAAFWAWSRTTLPEGLPTQVQAVVLQGPSILATGVAASAIGLFMVVATAGLWAYFIWRGPAPPDPAVVQALGAQLNWDDKEATEVVQKHNAAVDGAPSQTAPAATDAAPAPTAPSVDPAPAPVPQP